MNHRQIISSSFCHLNIPRSSTKTGKTFSSNSIVSIRCQMMNICYHIGSSFQKIEYMYRLWIHNTNTSQVGKQFKKRTLIFHFVIRLIKSCLYKFLWNIQRINMNLNYYHKDKSFRKCFKDWDDKTLLNQRKFYWHLKQKMLPTFWIIFIHSFRFCMLGIYLEQDDCFPKNLCVHVNGKIVTLPVSIYLSNTCSLQLNMKLRSQGLSLLNDNNGGFVRFY